ncbi:MAG: hypothetical protein ATN36_03815 [Epulopiscium sp. Nele67-Bin005]|nr:MAG: hypothetical protein ATN36_03815 [Epulopiscium sp. Nele67-Bin005]
MKNCYLLYGNENYIKDKKLKSIEAHTVDEANKLMNYNVFEGKTCNVGNLIDECETLPFLSEKKCIVVKNSQLFKTGRKDDTDKLATWIPNLPEYATLIFLENDIDRRNKLYKTISKIAVIEICECPNESGVRKIIEEIYGDD